MTRVILGVLVVAGFLSACAGGPRYSDMAANIPSVREDQARLTFFRESGYIGVLASTRIQIDGQTVGHLKNGSAFYVDRPPGAITVSADHPMSFGRYNLPVTTEAGKEYFFKVANRNANVFAGAFLGLIGQGLESAAHGEQGGSYSIEMVTRDEAMQAMSGLTLKSPN